MNNKETVEIGTIVEYVKANRVSAKEGRKCVDGRYSGSVDDGKIARPGGDGGFVEILLAFKNDGKLSGFVEEIVMKTIKATESLGGKFAIHTDFGSTPDPEKENIGCGHLGKASQEQLAADYLVNGEDLKQAIKIMKRLSQQGKIYNANLSGGHQEKAVLVVKGEKMSVKPNDGRFMAFIYDETRDLDYMKKLFEVLELKDITFEQFKDISDAQLNATLKYLAEGLPIFNVDADSEVPQVEFVGTV